MKLRYAEPGLHELDKEHAVCLVLTGFSDERPLRGLAGRVDWRLNGQLSRLMRDSFIDGHFTEAVLTPMASRLPFDRLLFVGMGARADFNEQRFAEICRFTFETLSRMHITDFAMALPGRIGLDVGLRQALRGWEDGIASAFPAEMIQQLKVCLIESADVQRELVEPLRRICRDLAERATDALEAAGQIEPAPVERIITAGRPAVDDGDDDASLARRRDWSTGMFRIVEEPPATVDFDEDDDEISVADVPATRRRSGLFTIPEGRGGREPKRAALESTVARSNGGWSRPQTTGNTPRAPNNTSPRRAPEFTGARRPSGQFAAVRRASGQYEIPTRRQNADFNAPPIVPPSEPIDKVRRVSSVSARSQAPKPVRPATPRRSTQRAAVVPTQQQVEQPWANAATAQPPGVHVEPPLLQTGAFDQPELSDAFHDAQQVASGRSMPTTDQLHAVPRDDAGYERPTYRSADYGRGDDEV